MLYLIDNIKNDINKINNFNDLDLISFEIKKRKDKIKKNEINEILKTDRKKTIDNLKQYTTQKDKLEYITNESKEKRNILNKEISLKMLG